MSNVIRFPHSPDTSFASLDFLDAPPARTHAVQLYEDVEPLIDTATRFVSAGLTAGDRVVVIATEPHREALSTRLGPRCLVDALASGQLVLLDAQEALAWILVDGVPAPERFEELLDRVVVRGGPDARARRVRTFEETADLLWRSGDTRGALQLERLWDDAVSEHALAVLCACAIDGLHRDGMTAHVLEVCRSHTHVIPGSAPRASEADPRRREVDRLEERVRALETEILHRRALEAALREALKERKKVEAALRATLKTEREASARAAREGKGEEVLSVLGRELERLVDVALVSVRVLGTRAELPPEGQERLDRIEASCARMKRMIGQALELASVRGSGRTLLARKLEDVAALVTGVVAEARAAHPERAIELATSAACTAFVDASRLRRVASILLGNALAHGDRARPVRVTVSGSPTTTSITVHNHGRPIDAALLPLLFDPLPRARRLSSRSEGLGLGLCISEGLVEAHGGKIHVESSAPRGTSFRVDVPSRP